MEAAVRRHRCGGLRVAFFTVIAGEVPAEYLPAATSAPVRPSWK